MKHGNALVWLHGLLSISGVALCGFRQEGVGVLVLCMSVMCLAVLKIDSVVAPDARNELADLASALDQRDREINTIYRRTATLGSFLDARAGELDRLAPEIARILGEIDSAESGIDIAIEKLRTASPLPPR